MGKSPAVPPRFSPLLLLRAGWLVVPLLVGPVLADALGESSRSVQLVTSGGLWVGWGLGLVAALIPRTVTLTILRTMAPAAGVAVFAGVVAGGGSLGWQVAGLVGTLGLTGLAFAPTIGHEFVNGSAYGDEARFPLRVPGPVLAGPVEAVWAAVVAGAVSGPLLLAAEQWVGGVVVLVGGWLVAWRGLLVLHGLARRWVVFVPAGMVLHDPLTLADPILLRRTDIRALGPAPADSDALDLTHGALGLALEVRLVEPAKLTLVMARRAPAADAVEVDRLLFTPTRPGALLREARTRRIS